MRRTWTVLLCFAGSCLLATCGAAADSEKINRENQETAEADEEENDRMQGEQELLEEDLTAEEESGSYDNLYPQHEPYGTGVGVLPGRVVWAYDPASVKWDGSGYWWETVHFEETRIRRMVDESVASLGGGATAREAWKALFAYSKEKRGGVGGYADGEKIAIKTNINGSAVMDDDTSGRTHMSYTNPVLLRALLLSLVEEAGVAPSDITVYDVSRLYPDYMVEMCTEGPLLGVRFVGRENGVPDEDAPILWSHDFGGRTNYLPTCVTEADYLINLANLKEHSYGVTLCGKNHFGSFLNGNAMRPPEGANLHQWLTLPPVQPTRTVTGIRWRIWACTSTGIILWRNCTVGIWEKKRGSS